MSSPVQLPPAPHAHEQRWHRNQPLPVHRPSFHLRLRRLKRQIESMRPPPRSDVLIPAQAHPRWAVYFVYSLSGAAFDQHRFTVQQLRQDGWPVLVVLACAERPGAAVVAQWRQHGASALLWKEPHGFDLSGLRPALQHLLDRSPGCDVLWLNDSLLGPFHSVYELVRHTPWRVTGFASCFIIEPHIQSYALFLRALDASLMQALSQVVPGSHCLNQHSAVAFVQETRLARHLSQQGSVGTLWSPLRDDMDLTMAYPYELVEDGFPFLKRSILGKFSDSFTTSDALAMLRRWGHPVRDFELFEGCGAFLQTTS